MQALARANHIRLGRAAIKREIRARKLDISKVVERPPEELETMTVSALLRSQRRWGVTRTRKFLSRLALGEHRTLGQLTQRQRTLLAIALR